MVEFRNKVNNKSTHRRCLCSYINKKSERGINPTAHLCVMMRYSAPPHTSGLGTTGESSLVTNQIHHTEVFQVPRWVLDQADEAVTQTANSSGRPQTGRSPKLNQGEIEKAPNPHSRYCRQDSSIGHPPRELTQLERG